MGYIVAGLALAVGIETWLLWRVIARLHVLDTLADRVAHFGGALTLLTETNELGFRSLADEVGRGARPAGRRVKPARATSNARRRGEVAAADRISEGEARLSAWLSGPANGARAPRISKEG